MKHWLENRFEDRMRFEDNRATVWDSNDLDEPASLAIDEIDVNLAEIEL